MGTSATSKINPLKDLRESAGLSQGDLARALGLSQAYISMLERGVHANQELAERALSYLQQLIEAKKTFRNADRSKGKKPFAIVQGRDVGKLSWAWSTFSESPYSSDLCEEAKIDADAYTLLLADIVGAGEKGRVEAAQIRFGFIAVASTLSRSYHHPASLIGPLAAGLSGTKSKSASPPSLSVLTLECDTAFLNAGLFGLPPALIVRKRGNPIERLPMLPADVLMKAGATQGGFYSFRLEEGDSLIMWTDGFSEWLRRSQNPAISGINELITEASRSFSGNAKRILNAITGAKLENERNAPTDDASIFVVSRRR